MHKNLFDRMKNQKNRLSGGRLRRAVSLTAAMTLLLVSICSCGLNVDTSQLNSTQDDVTPLDDDLIVVGYSQLGSESSWRTANTESVENALTQDAGFFLISDNARQKQENQIKAIRSFISRRVDYIVLSPVTEDGWDTVLQEAKDAGIPVIIADRKVNVEDTLLYTTWVGSDMFEEGWNAGQWLADNEETILQKGDDDVLNIVVMQGTMGSSAEDGRTQGFDSVASIHSNWNILGYACGDFTTAKGKEVMQQFLREYDDIDVLISQNDDMTLGAIEAMDEAGVSYGVNGDISIISFDGTKNALQLVGEGKIDVDVECNPDQGEYIKNVIEELERGRAVSRTYIVDEQIFTIDNVSDYIEGRNY